MEEYTQHFIEFIDTGLLALSTYQNLNSKPINAPNYSDIQSDTQQWVKKVKPNFILMKENILESIQNARSGKFSTIASAAGNFRGLSKDMDGIRETFMDFIDPEIKKRYFSEWKITGTMGNNIRNTVNQHWLPGSILDEEITGPIDEQQLLKFLQPGEQP